MYRNRQLEPKGGFETKRCDRLQTVWFPNNGEEKAMATYVSYSIRVEGRLQGTPEQNEDRFNKMFLKIFPKDPNDAKQWANDFTPRGLTIVHWLPSQSAGGSKGGETIWSFFAQAGTVRPGKMADDSNSAFLVQYHQELLKYRNASWYLSLRKKLEELNTTLGTALIERIWFREQQCIDGDGGDM
jgi:hypothetical protein